MFARIKDNQITEYPLTEWNIRERIRFFGSAPNFDVLLPADYVRVQEGSRPSPSGDEKLVEAQPVMLEGKWTRNWVVVPKSPEEIAEYASKIEQDKIDAFERNKAERIRQANEIIARYNVGEIVYPTISLQDWQAYAQALSEVQYNEDSRLIEWPIDPAVFLL